MNDFFQNSSDDLGPPGRVAAIGFHKASLGSRGW
jgi:hypothetical protein